jgi:RNA-directed DNA polymerase
MLEGEVKPLVEQFLQTRGLELSPKKTVITHVEKGFEASPANLILSSVDMTICVIHSLR